MVKVTSGSFGPHRTEKLGLEVAPNQALECVRYAHRTASRLRRAAAAQLCRYVANHSTTGIV